MDGVMPQPGFVFYLSITDTLELNVDRNNLEALGYATSLLYESKSPDENATNDPSKPRSSQTSILKRSKAVKQEKPCQSKDDAFPTFMQPDATYLSGVHLCKVVLRVHAMRQIPQRNSRLKFRYWELKLGSLYLEEQQIDSDELFIREATFHAGLIECTDFAGICERPLITSGSTDYFHLPFTASKVLGISPPSIIDTCALHARLVMRSVLEMNEAGNDTRASSTGLINMKTGSTNVQIDDTLFGDISSAANEALSILSLKSNEKNISGALVQHTDEKPPRNSEEETTWLFQVSTRGGHVSYSPMIHVDIPEADFSGKRGSGGLTFDTFLNGLGFKYEKQSSSQCCHLCSLPEKLRMHILVFLDDLSPLERVLYINPKKKMSAFLRGHAINKKLSAMKSSQKEAVSSSSKKVNRRTALLKKLQDLDDDLLDDFLKRHESNR
jgi:hypothetical protein